MSEFKGYFSDVVSAGTSIEDWQAQFKAVVTGAGWEVFYEEPGILDLIPEATEAIGNDEYFEVLRVEFESNTVVRFLPYIYATVAAPEHPDIFSFYLQSTVNSGRSITINGETVTVAGGEGSTYGEKRDLFVERIRANAIMMEALSGVDAYGSQSFMLRGVPGEELVFSVNNANLVRSHRKAHYFSNDSRVESTLTPTGIGVNVDLVVGFVYYISVFSRSVVFGTKRVAGFSGPIFGSYGDNSEMLDSLPDSGGAPIELITGSLATYQEATQSGQTPLAKPQIPNGNLRITHINALQTRDSRGETNLVGNPPAAGPEYTNEIFTDRMYDVVLEQDKWKFSCMGPRGLPAAGQPEISALGLQFGSTRSYFASVRSQFFGGSSLGILPAVLTIPGGARDTTYAGIVTMPTTVVLPDVFLFVDNVGDETISAARNLNDEANVAASVGISDTEMELEDASPFPEEGTVVIGSELISYTGKSGVTLTGCQRGYLGTEPNSYPVGEKVYKVDWFVKINSGALYMGTDTPEVI